MAGSINQAILSDDLEKAKEIALWHKKVFGEDQKTKDVELSLTIFDRLKPNCNTVTTATKAINNWQN